MLDAPSPVGRMQRAQGEMRVALAMRDGATVLADLRQQGCLKARFPRGEGWREVVTLNTSGGVAGGDRLESRFSLGAGARATFASQAAERFYRALPEDPPALVRTTVEVGAGACAEWLPQESILFQGCALDRRLDISLAEDAWFLGVETLVFGRAAMGERIASLRLRDTVRVRRGGTLVLHDAVRVDGDASVLGTSAAGGGAGATATLVHVAPDAEARLDPIREGWHDAAAECGASAWNGVLLARLLAADAARLRAAVVTALNVVRAGRALPRVWMC
jgi:urease accessory protein